MDKELQQLNSCTTVPHVAKEVILVHTCSYNAIVKFTKQTINNNTNNNNNNNNNNYYYYYYYYYFHNTLKQGISQEEKEKSS